MFKSRGEEGEEEGRYFKKQDLKTAGTNIDEVNIYKGLRGIFINGRRGTHAEGDKVRGEPGCTERTE